MRKWLLLITAVIVVIAVTPILIGVSLEFRYDSLLEEAESAGLVIERSDYQTGWADAHVETDFIYKLYDPAIEAWVEKKLTLVSEIEHGPFLRSREKSFGIARIESEILFNGQPIYKDIDSAEILTKIELNGEGRTELVLPPLTWRDDVEGMTVTFRGLRGDLLFGRGTEAADLWMRMPGIWMEWDAGFFTAIENLRVSVRGLESDAGLLLGNGSISIEQYLIKDAFKGVLMEMNDIDISTESNQVGGMIGGSAEYMIESLTVMDDHFGPFKLSMKIRNLDAKEIGRIQNDLNNIRNDDATPAKKQQALLALLKNRGLRLLRTDPRFEIDELSVGTPEGNIFGRLSIETKGVDLNDAKNGSLISKLGVAVELDLPEKLLMGIIQAQMAQTLALQPNAAKEMRKAKYQVNKQLRLLEKQGVIKRVGNQYQLKAIMKNNQLTVNGKLLDLSNISPQALMGFIGPGPL